MSHSVQIKRNNSPISITSLPLDVEDEAHFVFRGLGKSDVTSHGHQLHKYPARFIPQIPRWAIEHSGISSGSAVLDPFSGSGTSVVEAALNGHRGIGVDINPLSTLITRARVARVETTLDGPKLVKKIVDAASITASDIENELEPNQHSLGQHRTWSNWFTPESMAKLLAIRNEIQRLCGEGISDNLEALLLVVLSSIAKKCSYLDENQIKVRKVHDKSLGDPLTEFAQASVTAIARQRATRAEIDRAGGEIEAHTGSADALPVADSSIDLVVTSPPYINAVDYTMTHKYNLFLLGLIQPESFQSHSRSYIGMSERSVRAADLSKIPRTGEPDVDVLIEELWEGDKTSRNRAVVTAQYFSGMRAALEEMHRVLSVQGTVVMVVGSSNSIRGIEVPTGRLVEGISHSVGFETRLRFYHHIANRSSMRLRRGSSGGTMDHETVLAIARQ